MHYYQMPQPIEKSGQDENAGVSQQLKDNQTTNQLIQ